MVRWRSGKRINIVTRVFLGFLRLKLKCSPWFQNVVTIMLVMLYAKINTLSALVGAVQYSGYGNSCQCQPVVSSSGNPYMMIVKRTELERRACRHPTSINPIREVHTKISDATLHLKKISIKQVTWNTLPHPTTITKWLAKRIYNIRRITW